MPLRDATKEIYKDLLIKLEKSKTPATLFEISRVYKVDAKLPTYLVAKGLLVPFPGKKDHYIANYVAMPTYVTQVVDEFEQFRIKQDDKAKADKDDLAYYRKNRAFLVDTRNQLAMHQPEREALIIETRNAVIKEVIEYAELGIKLGKQDLKGFITTLLNIK